MNQWFVLLVVLAGMAMACGLCRWGEKPRESSKQTESPGYQVSEDEAREIAFKIIEQEDIVTGGTIVALPESPDELDISGPVTHCGCKAYRVSFEERKGVRAASWHTSCVVWVDTENGTVLDSEFNQVWD